MKAYVLLQNMGDYAVLAGNGFSWQLCTLPLYPLKAKRVRAYVWCGRMLMNLSLELRMRLLRGGLLLGVAILCDLAIQAADIPHSVAASSGLVGWWRGEGNPSDSVGEADGVLYRGVQFAPGKVGRCFAFDGISSGINVPDVPALALKTRSLSSSRLVPRAPTVPGMVLFRGDTRSGLDPYYVSVEPRAGTSGLLTFVVCGEENINAWVNASMPIGAWTHVAATLAVDSCAGGAAHMTLYTNAVVAAETNTTVRPLRALDPDYQPGIGIGNHSSQPGRFNYPFRGLIDELSVYNCALTPSEIHAIYSAGSAGKSFWCHRGLLAATTPMATTAENLISQLLNLLEQRRRGLAGHEGNNHDPAASPLDGPALVRVKRVHSVIAAFDVNIGLRGGQEPRSCRFGEDANAVHAFQRAQHCGAVVLGYDRAVGSL